MPALFVLFLRYIAYAQWAKCYTTVISTENLLFIKNIFDYGFKDIK